MPYDVNRPFGSIASEPFQFEIDTKEPTGWVASTNMTVTYDDANRRVDIAYTGDCKYYYNGTPVYKINGDSDTTGAQITDTEGLWFIYYDENGDLIATPDVSFTDSIISDEVLVTVAYWDADNNAFIIKGYERHGARMDGLTHLQLHDSIGTVFVSGLALGAFTADASGALDSHAQFDCANGVIRDEDISINIATGATQTLTPAVNLRVYYLEGAGANWRRTARQNFACIKGASRLRYNQFTGGAWQQTEATNNNRFVLAHLVATNDVAEPVIAIQGQNLYTGITAARAGAEDEIGTLITTGLPIVEYVFIGSVIFETSAGYANAVAARIRTTDSGSNYIDLHTQKFASTGTASDHGNLSGLQDQDHLRHPYWVTADQYGIPKDGVIDAAGPINTTIAAIGATNAIFYFGPGEYLLSSADVTFPVNIIPYFAPGAVFTDGGVARFLSFFCQPIASSSLHFNFTGVGAVLFNNTYINIEACASWFVADPTAGTRAELSRALNCDAKKVLIDSFFSYTQPQADPIVITVTGPRLFEGVGEGQINISSQGFPVVGFDFSFMSGITFRNLLINWTAAAAASDIIFNGMGTSNISFENITLNISGDCVAVNCFMMLVGSRFKFDNVAINASTTTNCVAAINLDTPGMFGDTDVLIDNCYFYGTMLDVIGIGSKSNNIQILNSYFDVPDNAPTNRGIYVEGQNVTIENNSFNGGVALASYAIEATGITCDDIVVKGNRYTGANLVPVYNPSNYNVLRLDEGDDHTIHENVKADENATTYWNLPHTGSADANDFLVYDGSGSLDALRYDHSVGILRGRKNTAFGVHTIALGNTTPSYLGDQVNPGVDSTAQLLRATYYYTPSAVSNLYLPIAKAGMVYDIYFGNVTSRLVALQRATAPGTDVFLNVGTNGSNGNSAYLGTGTNGTRWCRCVCYIDGFWLIQLSDYNLVPQASVSTSETGEDTLMVGDFPIYTYGWAGLGIFTKTNIVVAGTITNVDSGTKEIKAYLTVAAGRSITPVVVIPAANYSTSQWRAEIDVVHMSNTEHQISYAGYVGSTLVAQGYFADATNTGSTTCRWEWTGECSDADDTITQTMFQLRMGGLKTGYGS